MGPHMGRVKWRWKWLHARASRRPALASPHPKRSFECCGRSVWRKNYKKKQAYHLDFSFNLF
jgi:hypothetical protein